MNSLNLSTISQSFWLSQELWTKTVDFPQGKDILQNLFGDRFELTTAISGLNTETGNNFSGNNSAFDLIGLNKLRNDPKFAGIDGSGLSVVVIDTGIDIDHPLLAPNYIAGYDFAEDDQDPSDVNGHGTHVAGTIGATDHSIGVAPGVDLISLRVFDDYGYGSWKDIEDSLEWVLENRETYNITAVNMSLGDYGGYTIESDLPESYIFSNISDNINRLESAGVTVIAAAGNYYDWYQQPGIIFPAISSTLAVSATPSDSDIISSFSQRLDAENVILAPGENVTSTLIGGEIGGEEYYGTSMATPHVAGAVALLQQTSLVYSGRSLTTDEVVDILSSTADLIVDEDNPDDGVSNTGDTYRRINIYNAVAAVKQNSDNAFSSVVYRFFRSDIGSHFYTASEVEKDSIAANLPNYTYEGEAYIAATVTAADTLTGTQPVYRFFNKNTGAHLYTISDLERDYIDSNLSNYDYEGVAYYGYESDRPGTTALYRFYNPVIDSHFYTSSEAEKESIVANLTDYQLEGIAFYVEPMDEI